MKRPRSRAGLLMMGCVLCGLAQTLPARADGSCSTYLAERFAWMTERPDGERGYRATITTHRAGLTASGPALVSYGQVELWTHAAGGWECAPDWSSCWWVPAAISGSQGSQLFNDRSYYNGGRWQPFSIHASDSIGLRIDQDGQVVLTLESWGGGQVTITGTQCSDGLIYGFSNESPGVLYSISLAQKEIDG